ncbi:MAG TPA: P-loop NTPase fold protein, partial [Beijerinckia sp.]|nr:P-loop NTPase fold protein [Beijerinckia sp.]
LRNLGTLVPGGRRAEPRAPAVPVRAAPPPATSGHDAKTPPLVVFAADSTEGDDAFSLDPSLNLLTELAAHARTQTPFSIALLGRSGRGKSFALGLLTRKIASLARAAQATPMTPFLGKILTVKVDAVDLDKDPVTALATFLYNELANTFPDLAGEAVLAARDPRLVAREANDRLAAARRQLEAERLALADADSRRAKLTETVLYDAVGSQIDAYARTKRGKIESSLETFGITGDAIASYKEMVRQLAESNGPGARLDLAFRAFWAFKGQTRLIWTAIFLILAGIGLGAAYNHEGLWLGGLRANETSASVANWFTTHLSWLITAKQIAFAGAGLAILSNIWRALRFLQPVFRGASLLRSDLENRRPELDNFFAHQTRQVDALAAEVETLGHRTAEAEKRAGARQPGTRLIDPCPFDNDETRRQARGFFHAIGTLMATGAAATKGLDAPQRIIVALDNLDALSPARARDILISLNTLLKEGFVAVIAADPARLIEAGEETSRLEKWFQVPFQIGGKAPNNDYAALIRAITGHGDKSEAGEPEKAPAPGPEARYSLLDEPLSEAETRLLVDLAPLAGSSPRAVKRFVNLYRILRVAAGSHKGALALLLALDAGGTREEIAAMNTGLLGPHAASDLDLPAGGPRLAAALAAAQRAQGRLSIGAAREAAITARLFSVRS